MKKISMTLLALLLFAGTLWAQSAQQDFAANIKKSASNLQAYPTTDLPKLTPAPKGYTPFYIDHYGRHGSRWLISPKQYAIPVQQLTIAERNGKLTPRGKEVLAILRDVKTSSEKRLGELSDVGADQHRGIAQRMYKNFPEVFSDSANIDARSTIVIRCILSMENELQELKALNPKLKIFHDASEADMYYMNYSDTTARNLRRHSRAILDKFNDKHNNPDYMLGKLVTDMKFAHDSLDGKSLASNLFDVMGNMQSHHKYENVSLYDVFSQQEIYDLWLCNNAFWYVYAGYSPLTKGRMPYSQKNLLTNMIETADSAIAKGENSATLRFGHESVLLPLACLMELNNSGAVVNNLEDVAKKWQNYKIFPMGCNIQMVFYRKPGNNDVLVKVLLNEREAKLPIKSKTAPYYRWDDLRNYYIKKLEAQKD